MTTQTYTVSSDGLTTRYTLPFLFTAVSASTSSGALTLTIQDSTVILAAPVPAGTRIIFTLTVAGGPAVVAPVASTFPSGFVAQFQANRVPADWTVLAGTTYSLVGGMVSGSVAAIYGGQGSAAYVDSGAAQGLWQYKSNSFQCYSLATNKAVGPAYVGGLATTTYGVPFLVAVGKYIYYGAIYTASGTASNMLLRFDTETGLTVAMAPFSRALGRAIYDATALLLPDGRIIIAPYDAAGAGGVAITQSTVPFFIYDPVTNATPLEVIVSLPLTKWWTVGAGVGPRPMTLVPSGKVLLMDADAPDAGGRLSCLLTVSGNTITVGSVADTGSRVSANYTYLGLGLMPTASGAYCPATSSAFTEGFGWSTVANPVAYGSLSSPTKIVRVPGIGYVGISSNIQYGGSSEMYFYATGDAGFGSLITSARKN